jgi:hypothetical protein
MGRLQRRMALRSKEISHFDFQAMKAKAQARMHDDEGSYELADAMYRIAADFRAIIRPMAQDQRLDRELLGVCSSALMLALETADMRGEKLSVPGFTLAFDS